jgi:hypothetical protein
MKDRIIKLKLGEVKYRVEIYSDRQTINYFLYRNNKCKHTASFPKKQVDEVKMDIFNDLMQYAGYEIMYLLSDFYYNRTLKK